MPNRSTAAGSLALSLAFLGGLAVLPAGAQTPTGTAPAAPASVSRQVDIKATVRIRPQGSAFVGRGTFTGKPFTSGKIRTRGSVLSGRPVRVRTTITLTTRVGQVILSATTPGTGSVFRGKANVVRGTGSYTGIKGSDLPVSISSGTPTRMRLRGAVKLPVKR
jgi:hypothetical protein